MNYTKNLRRLCSLVNDRETGGGGQSNSLALSGNAKATTWRSTNLWVIATTIVVIGAIFLTACDESGSTSGGGDVTGDATGDGSGGGSSIYTCANGTAAEGTTTAADKEKCTECRGGFKLVNEKCVDTEYTCTNGTPAQGKPTGNVDEANCESCSSGYIAQGTTACVRAGEYFCTNGTPRSGNTGSTEAVHLCERCFQGYKKLANNQCERTKYTCDNGTPSMGNPATGNEDVESCQSCTSGFKIAGTTCVATQYTCSNGTAAQGSPAGSMDVEQCTGCVSGYKITHSNTCVATQYTCSNGTPVTNGKPSGNHDEEQCSVCNCGFGLSSGACNALTNPATVSVGASSVLSCVLTQQTSFDVSLGAPVDGLWPVYQYKLGTSVELVSVSEGTTDVAERRYRTACPVGYDATVDLDPSDSDSATTSICDAGFTLLAPIAEGVYRLAVRPTSGNDSATLNLRVKDTGLTQLPYGADTQVGANLTRIWHYMPVPVGQGSPHVQVVEINVFPVDIRFYSLYDPLNQITRNTTVGGSEIVGYINNLTIFGQTNAYTPTYTTTRAIELVRIIDQSKLNIVAPSNAHNIRFCNDNNNDNNCD